MTGNKEGLPRSRWRIPDKFLDKCNHCKVRLFGSDYQRIGVSIVEGWEGMFLDYQCHACKFQGRYIYKSTEDPRDLLRALGKCLDPNPEKDKEDILKSLNKIHSVSDLLRLGGDDNGKTDAQDQKDRWNPFP